MKIAGSFYDGKSSKALEAFVQLGVDHWHIITKDNYGLQKQYSWKTDELEINFSDGKVWVRHHAHDLTQLHFTESESVQHIKDWKKRNKSNAYTVLPFSTRITLTLVSIVGCLAGMYFFVLPYATEQVAEQIPIEYEVELGKEFIQTYLEEEETNPTLSNLVTEFVQTLQPDNPYPIEVHIVESYEYNAFAFPGGQIVIYSALLEDIGSSATLAALLGHELAHITERHSLKALAKSLGNALLISSITGQTTSLQVGMQQINFFLDMQNSRSMERDADQISSDLLCEHGYNQKGLVELFNILESSRDLDIEIPSFLSTHPLTSERKEIALQNTCNQTVITNNKSELEVVFQEIKKELNKTKVDEEESQPTLDL